MNIVFLDIDGVLQPYDAEYHFYNNDTTLINNLSLKYNTNYSKYNYSDVISTYYDWDKQAIARLKYILDKTNSKIIVSSNWKDKKNIYKMRDLLKIHCLDKYWFTDNIIIEDKNKSFILKRYLEINDSLNKYDISNFIVLDDAEGLKKYYPNNLILTHNIISIQNMNDAIKVLKRSTF